MYVIEHIIIDFALVSQCVSAFHKENRNFFFFFIWSLNSVSVYTLDIDRKILITAVHMKEFFFIDFMMFVLPFFIISFVVVQSKIFSSQLFSIWNSNNKHYTYLHFGCRVRRRILNWWFYYYWIDQICEKPKYSYKMLIWEINRKRMEKHKLRNSQFSALRQSATK